MAENDLYFKSFYMTDVSFTGIIYCLNKLYTDKWHHTCHICNSKGVPSNYMFCHLSVCLKNSKCEWRFHTVFLDKVAWSKFTFFWYANPTIKVQNKGSATP